MDRSSPRHARNVEGFDAVADSEFVDERIRL
jgi:hypothetical protein